MSGIISILTNKLANMSIPSTCKAQVFEKANEGLVLKDVEVKQPQEGEILVKVIACGVCHSDSVVGAGMFGPLPRIPGHEVIGDVVAVGAGEKRWKTGDRVGGGWHGGHDGKKARTVSETCIGLDPSF